MANNEGVLISLKLEYLYIWDLCLLSTDNNDICLLDGFQVQPQA